MSPNRVSYWGTQSFSCVYEIYLAISSTEAGQKWKSVLVAIFEGHHENWRFKSVFWRCLLVFLNQFAIQLLSILEGFADFRKCWVKFWTILVVFSLFLSVFVVLILIGFLSILNDFGRFRTILCWFLLIYWRVLLDYCQSLVCQISKNVDKNFFSRKNHIFL